MEGRHILEVNGVRGSVAVGYTQSHFGVGELRQCPLSSRAGDVGKTGLQTWQRQPGSAACAFLCF